MTTQSTENMADRKMAWIHERIAEGRTVYLSTALRHTKITAEHLDLIRSRNGNLEVLQGKLGWVNHNYSRLSAQ